MYGRHYALYAVQSIEHRKDRTYHVCCARIDIRVFIEDLRIVVRHAFSYSLMLEGTVVGEFSLAALCGGMDFPHGIERLLSEGSKLTVAFPFFQQFERLVVLVITDKPAAAVASGMFQMEWLVAFRSGSLGGRIFMKPGIAVVIAAGFMEVYIGHSGSFRSRCNAAGGHGA